nr:MAG TPA: hypothetical protein [Caudoviricetes sp.]
MKINKLPHKIRTGYGAFIALLCIATFYYCIKLNTIQNISFVEF